MNEQQSLHEEHLQELLHEETFLEKLHRIRSGLQKNPASGEYKWAWHEFKRLIVPASVSFLTLMVMMTGLLLLVKHEVTDEPSPVEVTVIDEKKIEPPKLNPPKPPEKFEPPEKEIELPDQLVEAVANVMAEEVMENNPTTQSVKAAVQIAVMSPVSLPNLHVNRTPCQIGKALEEKGGTPGTETAVVKALRWLKRNQNADGSWEGVSTPMTGLALLCFLAHGETPASSEFGPTVELAIKYLVSQQQADGNFANTGGHHVYGNAIANYALAEACAMTRVYSLREVMDKGIKVIIEGQQQGGGWDYNYKDGGRTDLSVMAWQVQALKAASIAGCGVEGLDEAKYKAIPSFKSFQTIQGGFGYTSPANRELTGAGVLCLQMLGEEASPEVRQGLEHMYDWRIDWENPRSGGVSKNPLYHWYYITQARFQASKEIFDPWNAVMAKVLPEKQHADGHWTHEMAHDKSPVYSTTLTCLMLEVYYRYLPTFKAEGAGHDAPPTEVAGEALKALEDRHVIRVYDAG